MTGENFIQPAKRAKIQPTDSSDSSDSVSGGNQSTASLSSLARHMEAAKVACSEVCPGLFFAVVIWLYNLLSERYLSLLHLLLCRVLRLRLEKMKLPWIFRMSRIKHVVGLNLNIAYCLIDEIGNIWTLSWFLLCYNVFVTV